MDWLKRTVQRSCSCNILKYLHALTTADGPHAGLANLGLQGLKEAQMSVDPRRHATQKLMKQAPREKPIPMCAEVEDQRHLRPSSQVLPL